MLRGVALGARCSALPARAAAGREAPYAARTTAAQSDTGRLEMEASASYEPRAASSGIISGGHDSFAGRGVSTSGAASGPTCTLRKQVTIDARRSHGRRGGRHRATLRHWLDQYEDPELVARMEYVLSNSGIKRAAVKNLEKMIPGADVKRLVDKYPVLLGLDKNTVAKRMVKLTMLIPGGDIGRMVEMEPMLLLVPDVDMLAEQAVDDIAGHLEIPPFEVWDLVGRHPSLVFQDEGDRRRAAMEYVLLDGNVPVGKDLSAVRPPKPPPDSGGYTPPSAYTSDV